MIKSSKYTIISLLLVFTNLLVKFFFISSNSLGGDEPFSVYHAQMNIASIIKLLSEGNNPPLYEILLHFWIKIFGISEISVRVPSLIFSCLTVIFIYKIGRKFLNDRIAICASVIFIFSNYQIIFAHEARVYALLGLLTAISIYVFLSIVLDYTTNKLVGIRKYLILAIVNTLIIYSHYFGFFVLIAQFVFLVFYTNLLKANLWKILLYISLILLLYLPNITVLLNRFILSSEGTWVEPPSGVESVYIMLWRFSNAPVLTVVLIMLFVMSIIKYFVNYKRMSHNVFSSFIIFFFAFIFFLMFGLSFKMPMFMDRYLMPATIAFPLVIGICADYLIDKSKHILSVILCLFFALTVKPNISNNRQVKETLAKISEIKTNSTAIYICPDWFDLNFIYYYNIELFKVHDGIDLKEKLLAENIYPIRNINQIDTSLHQNVNKIIFLDTRGDFNNPESDIKARLDLFYDLRNKYEFQEYFKVYEYGIHNR